MLPEMMYYLPKTCPDTHLTDFNKNSGTFLAKKIVVMKNFEQ